MTVQIIVQPYSDNSFWIKDILTGIKSICDSVNYIPKIISGDITGANLKGSCVIVVGYEIRWLYEITDALRKNECKTIIVNSWVSGDLLKNNNAVFYTLDAAVEQAVEYLQENHREKTVLFGVNEKSVADLLKKESFVNYFAEKNYDPGKVFSFKTSLSESFEDFLEDFSNGNIDSAICCNDTVAICLSGMMKREGFNLPEDLHIIGMGNSELGKYVTPTLTSFAFDYCELGRQAFWLWKNLIKDKENTHREVKLACPFLIRESTENLILSEKFSLDDFEKYPKLVVDNSFTDYYEDEEIRTVIKLENFFRTCDKQDIHILEGILHDDNDSSISERLFMSDRAIRYRINKMKKKLGVASREEMIALVRQMNIFEKDGLGKN